jgi:citrate lyase subunit beta-like protein
VVPVLAAFSPRPEAVAAARELVAAYERHQEKGAGAFVHHGHMVDAPTMLQARNVLRMTAWLERVGGEGLAGGPGV